MLQAQISQMKILHLDDDPFFREELSSILSFAQTPCRFLVKSVANIEDYLATLPDFHPDAVILDINLDGQFVGDKVAAKTKETMPRATILMVTHLEDFSSIRKCLKAGAHDYIFKSVDMENLATRLYSSHHLRNPQIDEDYKKSHVLVGNSLRDIQHRIPHIIDSAVTAVHIYGESGTGKELVSQLFEQYLPAQVPFIRIHCGAIAPNLLESELFGYEKGAFTGAERQKKGLIESAHGGWVFFDEIATLSLPGQVALLRVLENKTIRRIGGTKEQNIHIKVISATNEELSTLVKDGKFRQDLWQRLCETTLTLPPLRDRMGDLKELIDYFCAHMDNGPYQVTASVVEILGSYDWHQGNVRELRNCLRAMTEYSTNQLLTPLAIPAQLWEKIENEEKINLALFSEKNKKNDNSLIEKICIEWASGEGHSFDDVCNQILLKMIEIEFKRRGKLSLRSLAKCTGIAKSTLSTRLKTLIANGYINEHDLNRMVGSTSPII